MITLNDLLTIVDARQLRVVVPITPRLKARITVNTRNAAEFDDLTRLYGACPVFSAEPADEMRVMEIELTTPNREDLALTAPRASEGAADQGGSPKGATGAQHTAEGGRLCGRIAATRASEGAADQGGDPA